MFERLEEANPEVGRFFRTATPMGRIGQPIEIVNAVL
jgi:hypothetical protein